MTDFSLSEPFDALRSHQKIYLEKDIFFNPHVEQLESATAKVALNFRESILLQLLLTERVKKQAVIDAAWGNNGVVVTEASYHQLVRSLRKKFEEIGLPAQSIKTLPRFGLEYLREHPPAKPEAARPEVRENPTPIAVCEAVPVLSKSNPAGGARWSVRLLLLILPFLIGLFVGHLTYGDGQPILVNSYVHDDAGVIAERQAT